MRRELGQLSCVEEVTLHCLFVQLDQQLNPGENKADLRIVKAQMRKANKKKKAKRKYAKGSTTGEEQEFRNV
ncbi:hypothetical protein QFC24_004268 [Naganishia onofrii]|uniref:Uncharacterized protein n=1 Tax=Naganishia onofrii TaxID=1851511 RepID=A0ACC2XF67_9TREE|nr:hypothetical protein QFC24_004268 [Naganishia onofrii]